MGNIFQDHCRKVDLFDIFLAESPVLMDRSLYILLDNLSLIGVSTSPILFGLASISSERLKCNKRDMIIHIIKTIHTLVDII